MRKKVSFVLSVLLVVVAALAIYSRSKSAQLGEEASTLPGDDLIRQPLGSVTHAITTSSPIGEEAVAPTTPSTMAVSAAPAHPAAYQNIGVGAFSPGRPGASNVSSSHDVSRSASLFASPSGKYQTTWAFVLEQPQPDQARLIVRGRVVPGDRPYGLPQWIAMPTARLAHFIMQRKQLLKSRHVNG